MRTSIWGWVLFGSVCFLFPGVAGAETLLEEPESSFLMQWTDTQILGGELPLGDGLEEGFAGLSPAEKYSFQLARENLSGSLWAFRHNFEEAGSLRSSLTGEGTGVGLTGISQGNLMLLLTVALTFLMVIRRRGRV